MDSCAACHRLSGSGENFAFPMLAGNSGVLNSDPSSLIAVILNGARLPSTNDGLRCADAGLVINPNSAYLYATRGIAEAYLRQFEQAKSDVEQARRLSPRDPRIGQWHNFMASAELGLGHFDAAIDEANKAIDAGWRSFYSYQNLASAHALKGDIDQAKAPLAEARRLNPKFSVKWLVGNEPFLQPAFDALRKAGLPEE